MCSLLMQYLSSGLFLALVYVNINVVTLYKAVEAFQPVLSEVGFQLLQTGPTNNRQRFIHRTKGPI